MIKKILFILICFTTTLVTIRGADTKGVLVIPFKNTASIEIDYMDKIIQKSLISFFNIRPDYTTINSDTLNTFLRENDYVKADLYNTQTITTIAANLGAAYIITGKYYKKEGFLVIDFEVIETEKKQIIYRSSKFSNEGLDIFDTINTIAQEMVIDFTGLVIPTGRLKISTDYECKVYINTIYAGTSPCFTNLGIGKHDVAIIYENDGKQTTILERAVIIEEEREQVIDLQIFTDVTIKAEHPCSVYIDNVHKGSTPYTGKLLINNDYAVKLIYHHKRKKITVVDEIVKTVAGNELKLNYYVTGTLIINADKKILSAMIHGITHVLPLPLNYPGLMPGDYRVKIFIPDTERNTYLLLHDKRYRLSAGQSKQLNFNHLTYTKAPGLYLLPGAAQLYNKQYVKGAMFLSTFLLTAASTCILPYIAMGPLTELYKSVSYDYKRNRSKSFYEEGHSYALRDFNHSLFYGSLIGGIIGSTFLYLFSLIDGIYFTNYLDRLSRPDKKKKIKVKPILKLGML